MLIAIGSDEVGYRLKQQIKSKLEKEGHTVKDFGTFNENAVLYPDVAVEVAQSITQHVYERGILVCGTGIGMAISANKVPGIRAAVCHDPYSSERARKSNDAQIMCIGSRIIGVELAKMLIDMWLKSKFEGGRSLKKVQRINEYDEQFKKML